MSTDKEKRSEEAIEKQEQPGAGESFNNRTDKEVQTENTGEKDKDESESYMDYNGNSEENAPARSE